MPVMRMRDLSAYVAIGLIVAGAALLLADLTTAEERESLRKWVRLGACTTVVFVALAYSRRAHFWRLKLWGIWSALLLLHTLCLVPIVEAAGHWTVAWSVLLAPAEYFLADLLLTQCGLEGNLSR